VYGVTDAESSHREVTGILYGEHKEPHGKLGPDQPDRYLPELRRERHRHGAEGRLLLVLGAPGDADGHHPRQAKTKSRRAFSRAAAERARTRAQRDALVVTKTWHHVATCAEVAGRAAFAVLNPEHPDPRLWREEASLAEAPASQRILLELLTYFEMEGYAVTNGLTGEQVATAADALETENVLGALMDAVATRITEKNVGRFKLAKKRGAREARGQDFKAPEGSWIERCQGGLWIGYHVDERPLRRRARRDVEFEVGAWIPKAAAEVVQRRRSFKEQLDSYETDFSDGGAIWMSKPIRELIGAGPEETLEDQTEEIGDWVAERLHDLLRLKPGRYPL